MNWLKRLWWRITRSRQGYVEKRHDETIVNELKTICLFFNLHLEKTLVWELYDIPYNPIGSLNEHEHVLDSICRTTEVADRRYRFYCAMCWIGDISVPAIRALQCTPEWHEFTDWLKDE